MTLRYKNYFIQYEERAGKIVVSRATADGNFQCSYGGETFSSVDELKRAIDNGLCGIGHFKK